MQYGPLCIFATNSIPNLLTSPTKKRKIHVTPPFGWLVFLNRFHVIHRIFSIKLTLFSIFSLLFILQEINHIYHEKEFRSEWCKNNSTSVPCFLFARKFSRGAAMRLLSAGVTNEFDISTLMDSVP